MKKKLIIPIIILLITIIIIAIKLSNKKENKQLEQAAITYKNAIKNYNKTQYIENGDYVLDDNGIHNKKHNYNFEIDGIKPQNGSLTIRDNIIEQACLTINNTKVTIENDKIISQEKGICEYEYLPTKEEYTKEYIDIYISQIPSTDISETGIYDISSLNKKILLNEYPQEGWVSIVALEERIDILSYSIKFNDITVTNINGTQEITQK